MATIARMRSLGLQGKKSMVDDQNIVSVLEKHLDDTRGIVRWAISFGFVATILAVQGQDQIKIFNLEVTSKQAFWVFSAVYFFLCLGVTTIDDRPHPLYYT